MSRAKVTIEQRDREGRVLCSASLPAISSELLAAIADLGIAKPGSVTALDATRVVVELAREWVAPVVADFEARAPEPTGRLVAFHWHRLVADSWQLADTEYRVMLVPAAQSRSARDRFDVFCGVELMTSQRTFGQACEWAENASQGRKTA